MIIEQWSIVMSVVSPIQIILFKMPECKLRISAEYMTDIKYKTPPHARQEYAIEPVALNMEGTFQRQKTPTS